MKLIQYLRDHRGATSIECALGTMAMITASLLALDLYRLASAQTTSMYAAFTLADTVSRQEEETGPALEAKMTSFVQSLAKFLHQEQLSTADVTFVVSAVYQEAPQNPGDPTAPPVVLWTKKEIVFSTDDDQADEPECKQDEIGIETKGGLAQLPDAMTLSPGEVVIVAEVCVERKRTAIPGAVYAHYIVPSRYYDLADRLGTS